MSAPAGESVPGGTISLGNLPIDQLEKIELGMSKEVELLQNQLAVLTDGVQRLQASKEGSEVVAGMKNGVDIMVPLTGSIYVHGAVKDTNAVLVDIGTGYYVEKKPSDAADYFGKRSSLLKQEGEKTASALTEKRQHLEAVSAVLQKKKAIAASQSASRGK